MFAVTQCCTKRDVFGFIAFTTFAHAGDAPSDMKINPIKVSLRTWNNFCFLQRIKRRQTRGKGQKYRAFSEASRRESNVTVVSLESREGPLCLWFRWSFCSIFPD